MDFLSPDDTLNVYSLCKRHFKIFTVYIRGIKNIISKDFFYYEQVFLLGSEKMFLYLLTVSYTLTIWWRYLTVFSVYRFVSFYALSYFLFLIIYFL